MVARVTLAEIDLLRTSIADATRRFEESILPVLHEHPGFAGVYVLATDASLIATIRRAAEQHPLFVVESWPELREAVESGQCGIALLDAAVLGSRVANCVATLYTYHDRLVTLVAADRAAAHEYVGLLSGGRIHRLLIKPTAIGAVRLLIESATARRLQLREEAQKSAVPSVVAAATSRLPKLGLAAAGVVAVALLGVAIVAGSRLDFVPVPAPLPPAGPAREARAPRGPSAARHLGPSTRAARFGHGPRPRRRAGVRVRPPRRAGRVVRRPAPRGRSMDRPRAPRAMGRVPPRSDSRARSGSVRSGRHRSPRCGSGSGP